MNALYKILVIEDDNDINELLNAQNISGSVLSQMYNDDDNITSLAK